MSGYSQPKIHNVLEVDDVDCALYDFVHFQNLIDKHVPWALTFLFHTPDGILQEQHKFAFDLRNPQLKRALFLNIQVNTNQAKYVFTKNLFKLF